MITHHLQRGTQPLLISMPHIGTHIPEALRASYVPRALEVEDTDWHLDQLYNFADALCASVLRPVMSRYVIDLNRPPDDQPMYPGSANTELCPTRFFTGEPLYLSGAEPTEEQRQERLESYWQPYHDALQSELERLRSEFGFVVLWDAHSIRCELPWLFEGRLPDLNIGSANGAAADASITSAVAERCAAYPEFSSVVNGRFKGGYITRRYGQPTQDVHAIQMEMVQHLYMMQSTPWHYLPEQASRIQPALQDMVSAALKAARELHRPAV
jgi:N-formylglutamate deformylase